MFDSVYFNCPRCNAPLEAQSKAGDRTLANFQQGRVPEVIATDLIGQYVFCDHCDRSYVIDRVPEPVGTIPLHLREP